MREYFELGLVCLSGVGLALNTLVLYMAALFRQEVAVDTVAMTLVAVLDLAACLFIAVAQCVRWCGGGVPCWVDLGLFATASFGSLGMTAMLSAVRYVSIVRGWRVDTRRGILGCLGVLGVLWGVVVVRGLVFPMALMPSQFYCMPVPAYSHPGYVALDLVYSALLLPCPVVIVASYVRVTCHYRRLARPDDSPAMSWADQLAGYYRRVTLKLVLIVVAYFVAIVPEYLLSLLSLVSAFQRTYAQDAVAFLLMFSLAIVNPFFVIHLHEGSRVTACKIRRSGIQ